MLWPAFPVSAQQPYHPAEISALRQEIHGVHNLSIWTETQLKCLQLC